MALGVGAAVFTGYGVAWADDSPSSDAGPKATNQHSGSGSSASQNGSRAKKTKASGGSNSVSSEGNSAQADKVDNTVRANTFTGVAPSATASPTGSTTRSLPVDTRFQVAPTTSAEFPPDHGHRVGRRHRGGHRPCGSTSGGNPTLPVDSPVALALAAFTRREASSAASTTTPAAVTTTSANLAANSAITTTPTVTWVNGVLIGSVNAVCACAAHAADLHRDQRAEPGRQAQLQHRPDRR